MDSRQEWVAAGPVGRLRRREADPVGNEDEDVEGGLDGMVITAIQFIKKDWF